MSDVLAQIDDVRALKPLKLDDIWTAMSDTDKACSSTTNREQASSPASINSLETIVNSPNLTRRTLLIRPNNLLNETLQTVTGSGYFDPDMTANSRNLGDDGQVLMMQNSYAASLTKHVNFSQSNIDELEESVTVLRPKHLSICERTKREARAPIYRSGVRNALSPQAGRHYIFTQES